MTTDINLMRVSVILLFIITFVAIGWLLPAFYATYAPQDNFIEVHGFTAQDASVDDDGHFICVDRTVHAPTTGELFTELYLIDNNSETRVELSSGTMDRYFQEGRSSEVTYLNLPHGIEPGEYKYLLVIEMDLASDRVQRDFTYTSDSFHIENNSVPSASACKQDGIK